MKIQEKKAKTKKAYLKPKLRVIQLTADEVLSTGCKTPTSHPNGYAPGTATSCTLVMCSAPDGS